MKVKAKAEIPVITQEIAEFTASAFKANLKVFYLRLLHKAGITYNAALIVQFLRHNEKPDILWRLVLLQDRSQANYQHVQQSQGYVEG